MSARALTPARGIRPGLCIAPGQMTVKRANVKPPWKKKNPRKTAGRPSKHLSPGKRHEARARAKAAGRPYPNLVDNMAVARKKTRTPKKKS
jgi:hypothetical protein